MSRSQRELKRMLPSLVLLGGADAVMEDSSLLPVVKLHR